MNLQEMEFWQSVRPPLLAGLLAGVLLFCAAAVVGDPRRAEGENPQVLACQSGAGRGQSSAFNRARRGKGQQRYCPGTAGGWDRRGTDHGGLPVAGDSSGDACFF